MTLKHSLASILRRCTSPEGLDPVLAAVSKSGALQQDPFVVNQLVTACSRLSRTDQAIIAFARVEDPNAFVYNAMISGLASSSAPEMALQCYARMSASPVAPTGHTFSALVKACGRAEAVEYGEGVHGLVRKLGFGCHVVVLTSLVEFYAGMERVAESRKVFDEMAQRDVFAWTTMVSVYARFGDMNSATELFCEMPERVTATWNTMIAGFARVGEVEEAASLFKDMPVKNIISWTSMISCYSQNKRFKEAVATFTEMREAGVTPDEVTMSAVISASAHLGAIHLGEELHLYVVRNRFTLEVYIGSALIDMYAKCGDLERSLMVFFKLRRKNIFCWNSAIEGLVVHGCGREALCLFVLMQRDEQVLPNTITFVSLLSACTHTGFVEEGRRIFKSMEDYYGLLPGMEHFGCLVDLLSRAGLLKEAMDVIGGMRFEPNSVIWGALLGGCKIHKNLEFGRIAVEKLMLLEPKDSGYLLLFISMCTEADQPRTEVTRLRSIMEARCIQKNSPGQSWIEINGFVLEFKASDGSHPLSDEIYLMLLNLNALLRIDWYISDSYMDFIALQC